MARKPPSNDLDRTAQLFHDRLARADAGAMTTLVSEYRVLARTLDSEIRDLADKVAQARDTGQVVTRHWLVEQARYQSLLTMIDSEVTRIATMKAGPAIVQAQREVAQLASRQSGQVAAAALASTWAGGPTAGAAALKQVMDTFAYLDVRDVERMLGNLQHGSPLNKLLTDLGGDARTVVGDALVRGVTAGASSRRIAAMTQDAFAGNLTRAMTVARTEVQRVQRESTRQTYADNKDIVKGWIWRCAQTTETCGICWAMDGEVFDTDEMMDTHINCRCVLLPQTATWAELGFEGMDASDVDYGISGEDAFDALLSEPEKRAVLGRGKYDLYAKGDINLADLVAHGHNRQWGGYRYEVPLKDLT